MEFSVYKAKGFMPERELSNGELRYIYIARTRKPMPA
jgi:hypothetical protein